MFQIMHEIYWNHYDSENYKRGKLSLWHKKFRPCGIWRLRGKDRRLEAIRIGVAGASHEAVLAEYERGLRNLRRNFSREQVVFALFWNSQIKQNLPDDKRLVFSHLKRDSSRGSLWRQKFRGIAKKIGAPSHRRARFWTSASPLWMTGKLPWLIFGLTLKSSASVLTVMKESSKIYQQRKIGRYKVTHFQFFLDIQWKTPAISLCFRFIVTWPPLV